MPDFTAQQINAIEYRKKDACVVAGPGSGKTTVLVERYCRLVEDLGFRLSEILAITFTEKAAANMKEKLAEKFQHNDLRLRDLDSAWVSTIHGFCARLLRENAIEAGIDPQFRVLDAREAEDLQFECMREALDEMVATRREETLALIEALQTPFNLARDLTEAYEAIRSAGRSIAEVRAMPNPVGDLSPLAVAAELTSALDTWPQKLTALQRTQRTELYELAKNLAVEGDAARIPVKPINLGRAPQDARDALRAVDPLLSLMRAKTADRNMEALRGLIFDALTRFDEIYKERKAGIAALDFTNLEERTIEMLRKPETRDRVRGMFRQIMLDEYQDVNERQAELVRLIRAEDVFFAVGDVNQSIYGFRHARPEIFHRYRAEVAEAGKHAAELLRNFRSREAILRAVEAALNGSEGIEPRALVAGREFVRAEGPFVEVIRASGEDDDEAREREARWIAHRILSLGNEFRDFAVLCRTGEAMKPVLAEFQSVGIPYVCGRRESFLASREGRDISALLRVVENPRDGIALATALRSPLAGVSDEALLRLRLLRGSVVGGVNTAAFDGELLAEFDEADARRIRSFATSLRRWRADAGVVPLDVLIGRMLSDCGYVWEPGDTSGDNVEAYLHLARTRGTRRSLKEFLRELKSIESAVDAESELSDKDQGNRVQVMTAHAAKGLEFPITIIAGMDRGARQNMAAVAFTPEYGLGIRWKGPDGEGLADSWAQKNAERFRQRELEEENRLLYVAMTRAEERLILSYSRVKNRAAWARKVDEAFVKDTPSVAVQVWGAEADPPPLTDAPHKHAGAEAVAIVPRPAVNEQYDTAVNVTSLSAFAQCPRRYYIERYVGWSGGGKRGAASQADPDEIPAAEMGTLVHEILAGKPGEYAEAARDLAAVFERSELARRAATASRREREWDFISEIDGVLVRGTIDLWFEDADGVHIVDYKTDTTVRASEHAPQLALYAVALEKALGKKPASASLHYLRADRVERVAIDDEATTRARAIIGELRAAQETFSFPLNAGEHCRACGCYRSTCTGVDSPAGSV
ncbi:MAG TPA: UvrD-helicase domain-containing protein [Bryobacteraceae bacterium]|nr:UvrD-helicase domain-containing protein [Bryobacteraceae bacterium]